MKQWLQQVTEDMTLELFELSALTKYEVESYIFIYLYYIFSLHMKDPLLLLTKSGVVILVSGFSSELL